MKNSSSSILLSSVAEILEILINSPYQLNLNGDLLQWKILYRNQKNYVK